MRQEFPDAGNKISNQAAAVRIAPTSTSEFFPEPPFTAQLIDTITAIDAESWDQIVGDTSAVGQHNYFLALERAQLDGCEYRYILFYDAHDRLVAHASVVLVPTDFAQFLPRWLTPMVAAVRQLWPGFLSTRITECAVPLAAGSAFSLHTGLSRNQLLPQLDQQLSVIAKTFGSAVIVVRDFRDDELAELVWLQARGYKRVSNLPLARIRVRWRSYADYLGAMRSRYRKDIKRRLLRAQRAGLRSAVYHDFSAHTETWVKQNNSSVRAAQDFAREQPGHAYYESMNEVLGESAKMLVVEKHAEPIAHGMILLGREVMQATFCGRQQGQAEGEWFLLMDAAMRVAINRGCCTLNLGLRAYEAKTLLGAELVPLYLYTRCTNRFLNWCMRRLPDLMHCDDYPRHRVFKNA